MMRYNVKVKPGAKVEKVVSSDAGLVVYLRARAHDGEANEALIRVLAKHFRVGKTCVTIVKGGKSREKVVEVL